MGDHAAKKTRDDRERQAFLETFNSLVWMGVNAGYLEMSDTWARPKDN